MKDKREKLSAIIIAMSETIITNPVDLISDEAATVSLILSTEAWNYEIDPKNTGKKAYLSVIKKFEKVDKKLHKYLKSKDYTQLFQELRDYKREHHPDDKRKIKSLEITDKGNIRVLWEEFQ